MLIPIPGPEPIGRRDRVAAGLRRREARRADLPERQNAACEGQAADGDRSHGKGAKSRLVPISDRLAAVLGEWSGIVSSNGDRAGGQVLRGFNQRGNVTDSLSAVGLFKIVQSYGAEIDKPELAPHDLRRTYAQIGYDSGVPITQISKLLGHASVATTQCYLNLELDLETTVSDFVPL